MQVEKDVEELVKKEREIRDEAERMIQELGYIDLERLYAKFPDAMELANPAKFFTTEKTWPRVSWPGFTAYEREIRERHIDRLTPYLGRIESFRRFIERDSTGKSVEVYRGSVQIGDRIYGFMMPVWTTIGGSEFQPWRGEAIIWAIPQLREEGKRKKRERIFLHVYGLDEVQLVEGAGGFRIHTLDDVRRLYPKLVKEDLNVWISVLSLASRKNRLKDFWVMGIIVRGESSSGKSYLMKTVLAPWELLGMVEPFTRFTGAFLERGFENRNMDNVIIAIYELFSNTPQQLHLSLSEGKLRVGIVDKETGEPVTKEFEGTPFLFSTTPLDEIRPDLLNRIIDISIDESDEQTKSIVNFESSMAKDPWYAIQLDDETRRNAELFAGYLRDLQSYYVVVPYIDQLKKALKFYHVKLRRDWKKFIALIEASALLFQHDRPRIKLPNGEEALVATMEDFDNLIRILPAFKQTLINVSEREKLVLEVMRDLQATEYELTTRDILKECHARGWKVSDRRLRQVLNKLAADGRIAVIKSGRENKYELLEMWEEINFEECREEAERALKEFLERHGLSS